MNLFFYAKKSVISQTIKVNLLKVFAGRW